MTSPRRLIEGEDTLARLVLTSAERDSPDQAALRHTAAALGIGMGMVLGSGVATATGTAVASATGGIAVGGGALGGSSVGGTAVGGSAVGFGSTLTASAGGGAAASLAATLSAKVLTVLVVKWTCAGIALGGAMYGGSRWVSDSIRETAVPAAAVAPRTEAQGHAGTTYAESRSVGGSTAAGTAFEPATKATSTAPLGSRALAVPSYIVSSNSLNNAPTSQSAHPTATPVAAVPTPTMSEEVPALERGRTQTRTMDLQASEIETAPKANSALTTELKMLDEVRAALAVKQSGRALALLDEYAARGATGLAHEALLLRIDALVLGKHSAAAMVLARKYLELYPLSPHATRLRQLFRE